MLNWFRVKCCVSFPLFPPRYTECNSYHTITSRAEHSTKSDSVSNFSKRKIFLGHHLHFFGFLFKVAFSIRSIFHSTHFLLRSVFTLELCWSPHSIFSLSFTRQSELASPASLTSHILQLLEPPEVSLSLDSSPPPPTLNRSTTCSSSSSVRITDRTRGDGGTLWDPTWETFQKFLHVGCIWCPRDMLLLFTLNKL
jgi:hypothetical protein